LRSQFRNLIRATPFFFRPAEHAPFEILDRGEARIPDLPIFLAALSNFTFLPCVKVLGPIFEIGI